MKNKREERRKLAWMKDMKQLTKAKPLTPQRLQLMSNQIKEES